jgi:hypothetical protein
MVMQTEKILRCVIREVISESAQSTSSLLGTVGGKSAFVFGPNAQKFLISKGMTQAEVSIISNRMNNMLETTFKAHDSVFKTQGAAFGLKPSLLKAMSIEETTLGKSMTNASGSTAAGLLQITKPTVDTLNANLPAGIHYDYNRLVSDPSLSVKVVAHYIKLFLMDKKGLKDRASILKAYKTGPDSANYVSRVEAFKKFVEIVGL